MKRVLMLLVAICMAGTAFGAVKFHTNMAYNSFADSRIAGMSQGMGFSYIVGDYEAGWQWDNARLTATDSTNAGVHALTQTVSAMRIGRIILPTVIAGVELGQIAFVDNVGTLTQAQALGGLYGRYISEAKSKDVTTAIVATVGIRALNTAAGNPAGGWADTNITNLNSMYVELGISIEF